MSDYVPHFFRADLDPRDEKIKRLEEALARSESALVKGMDARNKMTEMCIIEPLRKHIESLEAQNKLMREALGWISECTTDIRSTLDKVQELEK